MFRFSPYVVERERDYFSIFFVVHFCFYFSLIGSCYQREWVSDFLKRHKRELAALVLAAVCCCLSSNRAVTPLQLHWLCDSQTQTPTTAVMLIVSDWLDDLLSQRVASSTEDRHEKCLECSLKIWFQSSSFVIVLIDKKNLESWEFDQIWLMISINTRNPIEYLAPQPRAIIFARTL